MRRKRSTGMLKSGWPKILDHYTSIAEFWFKFVGFILICAVFYAAQDTLNSTLLSACMWLSYFALYVWLKYEFEKAIYYIWPGLEPVSGAGKNYKDWQFIIANTVAPVFTAIAFGIGAELVRVLAK